MNEIKEKTNAFVKAEFCGQSLVFIIQTTNVIGHSLEVRFSPEHFKSLKKTEIINRIMKCYESVVKPECGMTSDRL